MLELPFSSSGLLKEPSPTEKERRAPPHCAGSVSKKQESTHPTSSNRPESADIQIEVTSNALYEVDVGSSPIRRFVCPNGTSRIGIGGAQSLDCCLPVPPTAPTLVPEVRFPVGPYPPHTGLGGGAAAELSAVTQSGRSRPCASMYCVWLAFE